nr:MAG TPA: hypothetical protein [Caudoviricetes sp.]
MRRSRSCAASRSIIAGIAFARSGLSPLLKLNLTVFSTSKRYQ